MATCSYIELFQGVWIIILQCSIPVPVSYICCKKEYVDVSSSTTSPEGRTYAINVRSIGQVIMITFEASQFIPLLE